MESDEDSDESSMNSKGESSSSSEASLLAADDEDPRVFRVYEVIARRRVVRDEQSATSAQRRTAVLLQPSMTVFQQSQHTALCKVARPWHSRARPSAPAP
eukprot:m.49111 g.49111  ORF g.49111 m.49111 type:complete len:100 (+) comp6086_c0_seq1:55-354(+)